MMRKNRCGAFAIALFLAVTAGVFVACSDVKLDGKDPNDGKTTYSVTFYYNYDGAPGSGVYNVSVVDAGALVQKPTDPTRTDYAFSAWTRDKAGTAAYGFSEPVNGALDLYAQWTENADAPPEVTLSGIEVTAPTKVVYTVGEELDLTGMTIAAVYSDNSDKAVATADCTVTGYDKTATGEQTVTVSYQGKTDTFTVTVNARQIEPEVTLSGIEVTAPTKVVYTVGEELDLTGMTITAVYSDNSDKAVAAGDCTVTGYDKTATGEQTVTVAYQGKTDTFTVTVNAATYTVSFAGEGVSVPAQTVTDGGKASKPSTDPQRTGYTFAYWHLDGVDAEFDFNTEITGNITLVAEWTAQQYTVTFTADGGEYASVRVEYDRTASKPAVDPQKLGYSFDGWFAAGASEAFDFGTAITGDIELTANFSVVTYKVQYAVGDNGEAMADGSYTVEAELVLPEPTVTAAGYNFIGWYETADHSGKKILNIAKGSTGDKVFYAYIAEIPVHRVTFCYNYDGAPAPIVNNVIENATLQATPADPTRTGYTFGGWYTDEACTDGKEFVLAPVTEPIFVYAKWERIYYTVTFDAQNGNEPTSVRVEYGATVAENQKPVNVQKTGHTFGYWRLDGASEAFDFGTEIYADTTLYAEWQKLSYAVTFESNGGSAVTQQTIEYDELVTKPADPEREGYGFGGWYSDAALQTAWNFGSDKVTGATTIYAKWNINKYTVAFDAGEGTGSVDPYTDVEHGGKISAPPVDGLTYEGHRFKQWLYGGKAWDFDGDTVTGNITLVAEWEINTYTVTFDSNGGSAVNSQTVAHGGTLKPFEAPARTGWTFVQWNLNGAKFELNSVITSNIRLVAQWSGKEIGTTYLYGSYTPDDGASWSAMAQAISHNNNTEWKIDGVELRAGMQFLVVTYDEGSGVWLHAQSTVKQWAYADVLTVTAAPNYDENHNIIDHNYTVSEIKNSNYDGAIWTLYINKNGGEISLSLMYASASISLRDPYNSGNPVTETVDPQAELYIMGNFTGGFKASDAWSNRSDIIKVGKTENVYTFYKVHLLPHDGFKMYHTGMKQGNTDNGWFGGSFDGLDKTITLTNDGGDIYFGGITEGDYTIVYNAQTHELTLSKYVAPTVDVLTIVSEPAKKQYYINEPVDLDGLAVSATYTDGDVITLTPDMYTVSSDPTLAAGENIPVTVSFGGKTASFTIAVKAVTVTFDGNGGSDVQSKTTVYNGKIDAPAEPTRTGYTFKHWYTDSEDSAFDFNSAIAGDITLTAKWDINKYTVTLDSDNGGEVVTRTVDHGGKIERPQPDPTKLGYTFAEWRNGDGAYDFDAPVTSNLSLKAYYTINRYSVTVDKADGSEITETEQNYGTSVARPADCSRLGYTFLGWFYTVGEQAERVFAAGGSMTVSDNVRIYAKWEIITYTIALTVTANADPASAIEYTVETATFDLPTPQNIADGYSFLGWYTEENGGGTRAATVEKGSTGNRTYYAHIEAIPTFDFTFRYNYDGADPATRKDSVRENGTAQSLDFTPTRTGYTFDGWYTLAEGGEKYDFTSPVTAAIDVYAHWTVNTHTVKFNTLADGLTVDEMTVVAYGATIELPAPTRVGYTLDGWYTSNEWQENTKWSADTTMPDNNVVLYAKWTAVKYAVSFDIDGGKGTVPVAKSYEYGSVIPEPTKDQTKLGYTFGGWYNGEAKWDFASKVTGELTLKAKWDLVEYTVNYYLGDGTNSDRNPEKYNIELGTVTLEDAFPPASYVFKEWRTAAEGGSVVTTISIDDFADGKEVNIHAVYEVDAYTVTFDSNGGKDVAAQTVNNNGKAQDPGAPAYGGYKFLGWFVGEASQAYDFDTPVTADLTLTAKWQAATGAFVDGKYIADITPNGSATSVTDKFKLESVHLPMGALAFYNNGVQMTGDTIKVRTDSANMTGAGKITGEKADLTVVTDGWYSIYYTVRDDGADKTGLWINYHSAYRAYDSIALSYGDTAVDMIPNVDDNTNSPYEVMVHEVEFTEQTTVTVKVDGVADKVSAQKDGEGNDCPNGTFNADGTITLAAGKYDFYYTYGEKTMWVDKVVEIIAGDYYIVGSMNDWTPDKAYHLGKNSGSVTLTVTAEQITNNSETTARFKIAQSKEESGEFVTNWTATYAAGAVSTGRWFISGSGTEDVKFNVPGTYTINLKNGKIEITSDDAKAVAQDMNTDTLYLVGVISDWGATWDNTNSVSKGFVTDSSNSDYFEIIVKLKTTDSFKFKLYYYENNNLKEDWNYNNLDTGAGTYLNGGGNNNLSVKTDGTYRFRIGKYGAPNNSGTKITVEKIA